MKDLPIPLPKTAIVYSRSELEEAAKDIGYPIFLRTDFTSLKHSWVDSALVIGPDELWSHAELLALDSMFQGLPLNAYILRELLSLEVGFTAFKGMPVHRERRFFLKDGDVQCQHPYWPEEAFQDQMIEGWKEKLVHLNGLNVNDFDQLEESAMEVAGAVPGYWTADFAKGNNGKWYLLDMAKGEDSYHWRDCKFRETSLGDNA